MCGRTGRGAVTALVAVLVLAGCAGGGLGPGYGDPDGRVGATAADGRGAVRPLPAPTGCTTTVRDVDQLDPTLAAARPGDRICVRGDLDSRRLILRASGAPGRPISLLGTATAVRGITVTGSHVLVSGFDAVHPHAPGIELSGDDITLTDSTVIGPRYDDGDGIRFFGHDIRIIHNTVRDVRNLDFAHADCLQTFATDAAHPASSDVLIEGNRCERVSNQCLIAEGPNSSAGDGSGQGTTRRITFRDNFCQGHAGQGVWFDDVHDAVITGNEMTGFDPKAFALDNGSTGARIAGNTLDPAIPFEVGMDDSSKRGYRGPDPGGAP